VLLHAYNTGFSAWWVQVDVWKTLHTFASEHPHRRAVLGSSCCTMYSAACASLMRFRHCIHTYPGATYIGVAMYDSSAWRVRCCAGCCAGLHHMWSVVCL
jgi:hypothetical protein